MIKKYHLSALLIGLILLISACKQGGATTGTAPRVPFIGGTAAITINFEKDSPPPEVTDDISFPFNVLVRLQNEGEFAVDKENIKLNLVGFDPSDFGRTFDDLRDVVPDDSLSKKQRDSEGNVIQGTPTIATFPKSGENFIPRTFSGNTEFTFRADVCYHYETFSNTKLCVLRDMININDRSFCKPNGARTMYSSSAPVQVANFRQSVIGKDKLTFSFDIVSNTNVDIFWDKQETLPSSFDSGCPRDPRTRRERDNSVGVELTEIPTDPVFINLKCGGLDNSFKGVVRLINNRRTIICTVELLSDRVDLEKVMGVNLKYNVLDLKETKVLIKHLANV